MIWGKFVTIAAFSGVTCLTRRPIGAVFDAPRVRGLPAPPRSSENLAVAQAAGQDLGADEAAEILALFAGCPGR